MANEKERTISLLKDVILSRHWISLFLPKSIKSAIGYLLLELHTKEIEVYNLRKSHDELINNCHKLSDDMSGELNKFCSHNKTYLQHFHDRIEHMLNRKLFHEESDLEKQSVNKPAV